MNKLILPPCPNWVSNNNITCSSDGILIYASRHNSIVLIYPAKSPNESVDIKFIYNATSSKDRLIAVAIDHDNWSKEKYIASVGTDNAVRLWDAESLTLKQVNNAHKNGPGKCVAINYINNTLISVTDDGQIALWNVQTNSVRLLKSNLCNKVKITCMATSRLKPHITCIASLYGDVFVIQTKGKGKVLHRVKCVDSEITTLSFCPILYKNAKNIQENQSKINTSNETDQEIDNITNKLATDCSIVNREPKFTKENVWTNLKYPDDDEIIIDERENVLNSSIEIEEPSSPREELNFLEECSKLQKDIEKICDVPNNALNEEISSPVLKKDYKKLNPHLLNLLNQTPDSETTTYDFLDSSTGSIEPSHEENTIDDMNKNISVDNLLLLKNLKENRDVSLASSLIVEIDESIDNISEFSEQEVRVIDIELTTPDSICEIEENVIDIEATISSENTEKLATIETNEMSDPVKEEINLYLAICCKYNSPSLWRIDEHNRLSKKFQIPFIKKRNKPKRYETIHKTSVCWATPTLILYSTDTGSLCAWDFSADNKTKDQKCRLIHSDHKNKGIYAITTPYYMEENPPTNMCVWTFGHDRSIICTSLSVDRSCLNYYPTCNGFIYSISTSPLDPNRIAIGCGDYTIRFFDISRPHTTIINMVTVNQNIKTKVMVTTWHPTKENCLAFSLHDGRIGIMDPSAPTKPVMYLKQYGHSAIYSLTWGPMPTQPNDQFFLYASSEGACIVYDVRFIEKDPIVLNFDKSDTFKVSEVTWKPDYSILSIGSKDGSIIFLTSDFKLLCTVYDFKRLIQCLSWHPQMTSEDNEESKYSNHLAVGTFNGKINVYNCEKINSGERPDIIAKLEGHTSSVNVVVWSPHTGGILMTGSSDGTVRIWNVLTQCLISTFYTGNSHIYTTIWSPFNSDIVMSGGRDCILHIWKISENPPILEIIKPNKGNSSNASIENTIEKNVPEDTENVTENIVEDVKEDSVAIIEDNNKGPRRLTFLPHLHRYQHTIGGLSNQLIENLINKYHNTGKTENETVSENKNTDNNSICDPTDLFGSTDDVLKLLDIEQNCHLTNKRADGYQNIALWRGNVKPMIESAMEKKALTPWLINLAPMVSIRFWRETCAAFAEQLKNADKHLEALSYYLAINDIENGINTLIKGHYYKEALIIAKTRLSDDDPTVKNILTQWAEHSAYIGAAEVSAECYVMLGKFEEAAKVLSRRRNLESLKLALKLAKRASNKFLVDSIELAINDMQKSDKQLETDTLRPLPTVIDAIQLSTNKNTDNNDAKILETSSLIEQTINNFELNGNSVLDSKNNCTIPNEDKLNDEKDTQSSGETDVKNNLPETKTISNKLDATNNCAEADTN